MIVSANSILNFRVLDHSSFRKDSLLGQQVVHLHEVLEHYNGNLENLELNMDILIDSSKSSTEPRQQNKNGELVVVLSGLKLDLRNMVHRTVNNGNTSSSSSSNQMMANGVSKIKM